MPCLLPAFALASLIGHSSENELDVRVVQASTDVLAEPPAQIGGTVDPGLDHGEEGSLEGPFPPNSNMVFYTVEGALYPLACFNRDERRILWGRPCQDMVPRGSLVGLSSIDSIYTKVAGDPVEPHCLLGSDQRVGVGVEGINSGAHFVFGTWPASTLSAIHYVSDESRGPAATRLDPQEAQKLKTAVKTVHGQINKDMNVHQVASIDVDGNALLEKVYSIYFPDPTQPEDYLWSGIWIAPDGDLARLTLLEESTTKKDVFEVRGTIDLDGDKTAELWMHMGFEDGGGDRLMTLAGGTPKGLGEWSCGA